MQIRDFILKDQNDLKALALKCWLFTYKDIYSDEKIRKTVDEWYSEKVHEEIVDLMKKGKAVVKVLQMEGKLIGLISTYQSKKGLKLERLYIDPDYIGQGFGSKLLGKVEQILIYKEIKEYFCFVHKKNKIGQSFYKKKGFILDETKSTKEDFYMSKKLGMHLIEPSKKYEKSWKEALAEFEAEERRGFWNVPEKPTSIDEYIKRTEDHAKGKNIPDYWVPATTYWLVDEGKFVGHVNIRHKLNDQLEKIGGHIGYAIRPSARNKGYGMKILELALPKAKQLGLQKLLVTCDESNIASQKIIEKNRGKFQEKGSACDLNMGTNPPPAPIVVMRYLIKL